MAAADIPAFGEAVAVFRTRAGLSQQKLADQLGKNRRTIAAWEAGDYLPKARGDVLELARIFKLNEEETTMLLRAAGMGSAHLLWNLPSPRNPFFTGREQELERLHTQLHQSQAAVVGQAQSISGLGGIGKTQLAIEYAYRHQGEYRYVLWARAESSEALNASYSELARLLNLPQKDEQEQRIVIAAVKRWLQRQQNWLLILDNADDPHLLPDFLPPTVGGHLLITTRAAEIHSHVAGLAHPLVVEIFSDEQGALFLLHRSDLLPLDATLDQAEAHTRQLAMEISHELGGLPLALDQASAYLKATGCSLAVYQQLYQQRRAQLLKERRGADHPEPVATTWDISFHDVEQENPAAADMLRLCAFFAPEAIPEEIFTAGGSTLGPVLAPVAADSYLLNQAIEVLRTYSLIARDSQAQTLTVHRLVQAVLRDKMPTEAQQQWNQRAVQALDAVFPLAVLDESWRLCERLLPHALTCIAAADPQEQYLELASLQDKSATYLSERAQYVQAESLYLRALRIEEHILGPDHLQVANLLDSLANLYTDQGKYDQAESLYQRALHILEQVLGPEHPHIAELLGHLAILYESQGKYADAESFHQQAIQLQERISGAEHPNMVSLLNNLAEFYRKQRRYEQAESLYQRALHIEEQTRGPESPHIATCLYNLALVYLEQYNKGDEAVQLLERALQIREQVLGPEHPEVATCLEPLAASYAICGKRDEAESLYQRALTIRQRQNGPQNLKTAETLSRFADFYATHRWRPEKASLFYQQVLAIREEQLGVDHPLTLHIYPDYVHLLALWKTLPTYRKTTDQLVFDVLYRTKGGYGGTEPFYQYILAYYEHVLGREHYITRTLQDDYPFLLRSIGRDAEAKQLEEGI